MPAIAFLCILLGDRPVNINFFSKVSIALEKYVSVTHGEPEAALVMSTVGVALMAWEGRLTCSRCPASHHASGDCCSTGSNFPTICIVGRPTWLPAM